jgi:hypothetical protein
MRTPVLGLIIGGPERFDKFIITMFNINNHDVIRRVYGTLPFEGVLDGCRRAELLPGG